MNITFRNRSDSVEKRKRLEAETEQVDILKRSKIVQRTADKNQNKGNKHKKEEEKEMEELTQLVRGLTVTVGEMNENWTIIMTLLLKKINKNAVAIQIIK